MICLFISYHGVVLVVQAFEKKADATCRFNFSLFDFFLKKISQTLIVFRMAFSHF